MLLTRPVLSTPVRRARRTGHGVFAAVLAVAAALRVLMMLGYNTAQVYWYDSFTYLDTALHMKPSGAFHPAGYSAFLWLLSPFHSVRLVAGVQHVMGLGIGVLIYAILRRKGLPGWAAALATVPVLLNPAFFRIEHAILSETLLMLLIVGALAAMTWRRPALAGLLIGCAGLVRTAAVPLLGIFVLSLVVRRAGWRPVVALLLAGGLPLAGYAAWFQQHHGRFALSGADGVSLWARTMTFADCSIIKPGPDLARLCPNGTVVDAASEYVWAPGASLNRLGGDRFSHNDLARRFAVKAILAQPLDYLADVARDASLPWSLTPVAHPKRIPQKTGFPIGSWDLPEQHALIGKVRKEYDRDIAGLRSVEPYAPILAAALPYPYVLHGPLFLVMLAAGLARPSLPWATAVFLYLGPIAAMDFDHRYMLPAMPVACVGAAYAVFRPLRRGRPRPGGALPGR
ncbi:hypothetical protein [Thermoactinospora rubra]|uniref:hypothetical protein n=1 Tax=Thermoactinospora rubra TaxID=1088767 RepID=UPI000A113541|nr:hypothetical protein [Thermoactinospora rubra]